MNRYVLLIAVLLAVSPVSFSQDWGREHAIGGIFSYSPTSSHILIGEATNRQTIGFGVVYTQTLAGSEHLKFDFMASAQPYFRNTDPTMVAAQWTMFGQTYTEPIPPVRVVRPWHSPIGSISGGANSSVPVYPVFGKQSMQAFEFSPVGFMFRGLPTLRIQPTFSITGGIVVSKQDFLVDNTTKVNYEFTFGPGVEYFLSPRNSIHVDYVFRHISNANTGANNPGMDQGVIEASFKRYF